ncbi:MAG TPA: VOC family protein [Acidimicrobiales bacterium]|nr:VOC family protein [Acidimicrobiales bacterium]
MTSISPWLSVADTAAALAFYTEAFGARVAEQVVGDGVVEVANLVVDDGPDFWVQRDESADVELVAEAPVRMILAVDDPDAVFAQAVMAGAEVVWPVGNGRGWRLGRLIDPCGHHWEIGRRLP